MFGPQADQVIATGYNSSYSMSGANYATGEYEVRCKCYYSGHEADAGTSVRYVYVDRTCSSSGSRKAAPKASIENLNTEPYPNPTSGIVRINFPLKEQESGKIHVKSSTGKTVYERSLVRSEMEQEIDLTSLPTGIYLIIVETNLRNVSKKVVLTR